ncbi:MAG TPA: NUDIX hydrolase [Candidatus Saccharimonadales bacterium]
MPRTVPDDAILIPEKAKKVFEGVIFDVYQWPQELFDGSTATFELLKRPDTVLILAVKDDKIIFVREQQPGRPEYVRLPGGRVDPGEDWRVAAERECAEELGLGFTNWRLIDVHQPVAKMEWFVATYLATDLTHEQAMAHDAGEKITLELMTFDEARAHTMSGKNPFSEGSKWLFEKTTSINDLKNLPEFRGKIID